MPGKIPDDSPDNISIVSLKQHQAYNLLFGHRSPKQIADLLNRIWVSTKFRMIAVNRDTGLTVSEVLALKEEMEATPMS
jgi:hypothetical protein